MQPDERLMRATSHRVAYSKFHLIWSVLCSSSFALFYVFLVLLNVYLYCSYRERAVFRLLENIDGKFMRDARCAIRCFFFVHVVSTHSESRSSLFTKKSYQGTKWQIVSHSDTPVDNRALASCEAEDCFLQNGFAIAGQVTNKMRTKVLFCAG